MALPTEVLQYIDQQERGLMRRGYHELQDRDEWKFRIGIEQTDLWPDDDTARPLPPYGNAYPNFSIDHHAAIEGPDPVQAEYPDLEVHSYALVVPERRLITLKDGTQGAPFWMNFNDSDKGAVVVSLKGANPLTYNPARAVLDYEEIEAWGGKVRVQTWIPLVGAGRDWVDGWPTDPTKMHEEDATVRQAILTTNRRLGVAQYVIPPEERKKTLSFLVFRPVQWEKPKPVRRLRGAKFPVSDEQFAKRLIPLGIGEEFEVAAGGLITQKIVRDHEGRDYYRPEPIFLVRYYPVSEEQAQELVHTMPPRRDAIRDMGIPTFSRKG